ncbi:MAG: DNA polymerase IV [Deltaproteobacteria bacterium]|nr:MAG: DNA polymerase IV [Deltaproteobacteria bacterium]
MGARHIIHLDMDAFYPAVEVLDHPDLKGKPVIVGGIGDRGVVSSASYEAREFSVHSAQPMVTARRLCPQGIFLPVRMGRYREISEQIFRIFHHFTPLVEPLSIDEAFLDVTGSTRLFGEPEVIARKIKTQIVRETGLTASAGVAPSKFVAKIASDMDKPDGLVVVPPENIRKFLDPLPIEKMWGVGKVTREALGRLGVRTFRDLSRIPVKVLKQRFGKQGIRMHELSLGLDQRRVVPEREVKSLGHEETFAQDIEDVEEVRREILALSSKVARRLRRKGIQGKTVTLKVKYSDFVQITRSATLPLATDDGLEIFSTAARLLLNTEAGKRPIRLLGVVLSQLEVAWKEEQLSLFEMESGSQKRRSLNQALDSVSAKHGEKAVRPGSLFTP